MRVAVYYNNNDVRLQDIAIPKISNDEILVKVMASGICGSDVMEWYRIKKAPVVLGHEVSGVVADIGKNAEGFKIGDRVFVSHHVPCTKCNYCLNGHETACEVLHTTNFYPGGFSEFVKVPKLNVSLGTIKLPQSVSFEEGAFIEPLGCVVRAQRIAGLKEDSTLLVIGSGISGLMHIALGKSRKIKKIIAADINGYRLNAAKRLGADFAINAAEDVIPKIKEINENRLVDCVIVCTGSLKAAKLALKCADRGGLILFFAVPNPEERLDVPISDFWKNEIKIATSYGAAPSDLRESLKLIAEKKINVMPMISHKLPLERAGEGFRLVADAKDSLKVIIEPNRRL